MFWGAVFPREPAADYTLSGAGFLPHVAQDAAESETQGVSSPLADQYCHPEKDHGSDTKVLRHADSRQTVVETGC